MNYHAEVLCDIHFPFPPVCMKAVNLLKQQKKGRDKISPIPALSLSVFSCKKNGIGIRFWVLNLCRNAVIIFSFKLFQNVFLRYQRSFSRLNMYTKLLDEP